MTRFFYYLIVVLSQALNLAILARIVLSWLPINPDGRLARLLFDLTEPILAPIRRVLPSMGGLDLSPMIALVLISLVERVLLMLVR